MRVLQTRRPGQKVVVCCPGGCEVVVEVLAADRRGNVALAVSGRPPVRVYRAEELERAAANGTLPRAEGPAPPGGFDASDQEQE